MEKIEILCLKVKQLCPRHKLKNELYRPTLVGGKVLGPATEQEKTARVAISCLLNQADYHAGRNYTGAMFKCLELITEIKKALALHFQKKYALDASSKVSFNKNWEVVLV